MSAVSSEFRVGDSPGYAMFSIFLHGGAGLMLLLTGALTTSSSVGLCFIVLACCALLFATIRDLQHFGVCRGPDATIDISIGDSQGADFNANWRLTDRSGRCFGPAAVTGGRVLGAAVWLHLCDQAGRRQSICVPADAMNAQMFRRLRIAVNRALGR
ncbi:MAG: hypothetical protein ACI8W7_001490 [Gammaproteobacteria bacterium]|jgi:hypothetical protein